MKSLVSIAFGAAALATAAGAETIGNFKSGADLDQTMRFAAAGSTANASKRDVLNAPRLERKTCLPPGTGAAI